MQTPDNVWKVDLKNFDSLFDSLCYKYHYYCHKFMQHMQLLPSELVAATWLS